MLSRTLSHTLFISNMGSCPIACKEYSIAFYHDMMLKRYHTFSLFIAIFVSDRTRKTLFLLKWLLGDEWDARQKSFVHYWWEFHGLYIKFKTGIGWYSFNDALLKEWAALSRSWNRNEMHGLRTELILDILSKLSTQQGGKLLHNYHLYNLFFYGRGAQLKRLWRPLASFTYLPQAAAWLTVAVVNWAGAIYNTTSRGGQGEEAREPHTARQTYVVHSSLWFVGGLSISCIS